MRAAASSAAASAHGRALGGNPAVTADVWARYPEIDAAIDRDIVAITVTGPAGAVVTLDDQPIGAAPATAFAHAGRAQAAAHERAPDPTLPLVREPRTKAKPDRDPTRWWVYAAIGGALVAGAAAIYAADAGDDHQRFELSFP